MSRADLGALDCLADFEEADPDGIEDQAIGQLAACHMAVDGAEGTDAERGIKEAVEQARARGYSWAFIGKIIGTSGEAARQRYGHTQDA